jgi:nicotinamide phosphoribosyltransferase
MTNFFQPSFMLLTDGYKVDHRRQYPEGTQRVFANLTPRKGRDADDEGVIFFGLQAAIQRYLIEHVQETFFNRDEDEVAIEYFDAMLDYLGPNEIGVEHVRALHRLGYLPLQIRAVPEGTFVPYGVPVLTIENTVDEFYWVTNYIETLFSAAIWKAITSATTAFKYRVALEFWAAQTGTAPEFVDWQGHDFSFRGMSSPESAMFSGAGHLTAFTGTDTIPAIHFLRHYYDADGLVGGSVPATEHSVMCAGGKEDELETFERLLDLYPEGIVSVVSDTWDLWKVLTEYLPALKDKIMARNGKLVVRPDSGDPVKIICGDPDAPDGSPARFGVVRLLAQTFDVTLNEEGYMVLNEHVGTIYGDSITLERANEICRLLAEDGFASGNVVFGIGSYTYQYNTRDTHGFAIKATWAQVNGEEHLLFKDPVTDDGTKRSARGRLIVAHVNDELKLVDGMTEAEHAEAHIDDLLQTVFLNGHLGRTTLAEIRGRIADEVAKRL